MKLTTKQKIGYHLFQNYVLITALFLVGLCGCATIKEIVANPTVLDGVRELVKIATDKVAEKNPVYSESLDQINLFLADYQGDDIRSFELVNLIYNAIGENDALKELISDELEDVVGKVTASGSGLTAESVVLDAARML